MNNTDAERIVQLEEEIAALKEQLQPYLDADEEQRKEQQFTDRLQNLTRLLAPRYNSQAQADRPPHHPDLSDWWNGAAIDNHAVQRNGDIEVTLRSYIGDGEYDHRRVTLPKEWMILDNPKDVVQQWCIEEGKKREKARKEYERKQALRQIEKLTEELQQLNGNDE